MIGLIDCNNFFVSCERLFRPDCVDKPVVVMSNNDGCAVAMSNEAKALGIKRGVPIYQVRKLIEENDVTTFSGNHRLYGDISSRVMATISSMVPDIEVYSIDEAFLDLSLWKGEEAETLGREIVKRVRRDVGIPTSLGIADTKTLAKVASHFAKKYKAYRGVCIIDSDEKRRKALALTEIDDVWGIGRRLGKRLREIGVDTALKFADMPLATIRRMFNIVGERTWRELNGSPQVNFEVIEPDRKQICTSRTMSKAFDDVVTLREAISSFTDNVARKLRRQRGMARTITVFIQTNAFNTNQSQHYGNATITLDEATDDTITLTDTAVRLLYGIFRKGYAYKRAGVIVTDIVNRYAVQRSLFVDYSERERRSRLMSAIDAINSSEATRDKLHLASNTSDKSRVKRNDLSPHYSTRISDIINVKYSP